MCVVSFVTNPITTVPWPSPPIPPAQYPWTLDTWSQFKEILEKLKDLDAKLGLKDCEDPEKGRWMKEVEERLKRLEAPLESP